MTVGAIGEQKSLWVTGDIHCDIPKETWNKDGEYYYTAINDTINNLTIPNIYFNVGDGVDGTTSAMWSQFHNIFSTAQATAFKNYTIGNHEQYDDTDWWNYAYRTGGQNNFTYQYGNILFIVIGDNQSGLGDGDYSQAYPFLNTTVQANQDKNIIVISHHPLENTTNLTWNNYDCMTRGLGGEDCIWLLKNYDVSMWIHGHTHLPANYTKTIVDMYGTLHISTASITMNMDTSVKNNYAANWGAGNKVIDSTYINFTKGSTRVTIQRRNHNTSTWFSTQYLNTTIDDRWVNVSALDFPFQFGTAPTISNPIPANQTNVTGSNTHWWNCTITDIDGDTMNWTITLNNSNMSWGNLSSNGTISCQINLTNSSNYTVWVNVTDDGINWTNETFWFRTNQSYTNLYIMGNININSYDSIATGNSVFGMVGVAMIIGTIILIIALVGRKQW